MEETLSVDAGALISAKGATLVDLLKVSFAQSSAFAQPILAAAALPQSAAHVAACVLVRV
eukprot:3792461-Pleurochrysis_carterae.AAC.1